MKRPGRCGRQHRSNGFRRLFDHCTFIVMNPRHNTALGTTLIAVACLATCGTRASSQDLSLRGRLSADARHVCSGGERTVGGAIRYLPQLQIAQVFGPGRLLDLEISTDAFVAAATHEDPEVDATLYRLKLRLGTQRTETRLGLQQLNFGPAYLLRPLRWFDILDPRDPLMLTDGVYALSVKYTAQSNASLWLWSLYGNDEPKGAELFPSVSDEPELGGRVQIPVPRGETAFTYHRRWVAGPSPFVGSYREQRFGFDGRWDTLIGFWIEATLTESESAAVPFDWSRLTTLGADYTLPLGNGVHVLFESMGAAASEEPLEGGVDSWLSGLMLGYSPGYRDRLTAIAFQDWDADEYTIHATWERSWDNFALSVSAFRQPDSISQDGLERSRVFSGNGAQFVVTYNH